MTQVAQMTKTERDFAWAEGVIREMRALVLIVEMIEAVRWAESLPLTGDRPGAILKTQYQPGNILELRFRPDQARKPDGKFAYEGGGGGGAVISDGGVTDGAESKGAGSGSKLETGKKRIQEALKEQLSHPRDSSVLYQAITENHFSLAAYTPKTMKEELEAAGFTVRPLGDGNFQNKPFESGGGYRINFGGDGIFQYHPEKRSHHNGAYWKIQTGRGRALYDMDGNEKED